MHVHVSTNASSRPIGEVRMATLANLKKQEEGNQNLEIEVTGHGAEPVGFLQHLGDRKERFKAALCPVYLQLRIGGKHVMFGDCFTKPDSDVVYAVMGFTINDDVVPNSIISHIYTCNYAKKIFDEKLIDITDLVKLKEMVGDSQQFFTDFEGFAGLTKKTCFLMKVLY